MKQLTRQEVEAVVEMLENPNPILQCPECWNDCVKCTECDSTLWKNDHTYIGTVLEKIIAEKEEYLLYSTYDDFGYIEELVQFWRPLGISRSLQEIIMSSGYQTPMDINHRELPQELVSPEANALFSFLQEII